MDLEMGHPQLPAVTCQPSTETAADSSRYQPTTEEAGESSKSPLEFKHALFFEKNEATGLVSVRFSYPLTDSDIHKPVEEVPINQEIKKKCIVESENREGGWSCLVITYGEPIKGGDLGIQNCEVALEDYTDEQNVECVRVRFNYHSKKVIQEGTTVGLEGHNYVQICKISFISHAVLGWLPVQIQYDPLVKKLEKIQVSIPPSPIIRPFVDKYKRSMICKLDGPEDLQKVRVVAIGPYHHDLQDKGELYVTTEKKWEVVTFLQKYCRFNWKSYFSEIKKTTDCLSCYELDKFEMDKDVFLEMMLLDACFLIFVFIVLGDLLRLGSISRFHHGIIYSTLETITRRTEQIKLDLLMYDNQIPFSAIECVPSVELEKLTGRSIKELAFMFFSDMSPPRDPEKRKLTKTPQKFHHVLHLFHWSRTPFDKYQLASSPLQMFRAIPTTPLEMFRAIPAASELQESGISFNKKRSDSPLDITFSHRLFGTFKLTGIINMPTLVITDHTKYVLHMLVIFEQHQRKINLHTDTGLYATSYVALMWQLVKSENDVLIFRRSGILANTIKTDKEVLETIRGLDLKQLSDGIQGMNLKMWIPSQLYKKIREHHGRKCNIRYEEFRQNYCGNMWITLSVVAAIVVFFFSGLQAVYSVLSYHFPKQ